MFPKYITFAKKLKSVFCKKKLKIILIYKEKNSIFLKTGTYLEESSSKLNSQKNSLPRNMNDHLSRTFTVPLYKGVMPQLFTCTTVYELKVTCNPRTKLLPHKQNYNRYYIPLFVHVIDLENGSDLPTKEMNIKYI